MRLNVGDTAPFFQGKDQDGNNVSLADFAGKKLVLYFYPNDDTTGCTIQACNLRDNYDLLLQEGYAVLGVSANDEESHKKFIEKYNLPFPLIADTDKSINELYGVWVEKNMYGNVFMGTKRTTFIIDEQGVISEIITDIDKENHAAQILKKESSLSETIFSSEEKNTTPESSSFETDESTPEKTPVKKKAVTKKSTAKKATPKKATKTTTKTTAKKTAKPAAKKVTAKKPTAKKTVKKATKKTAKPAAKKVVKKTASKKPVVKKATTKKAVKPVAKKTVAKKAVKKAVAKKKAVKKAAKPMAKKAVKKTAKKKKK
jgi:peroxiredoxin Q/BCP